VKDPPDGVAIGLNCGSDRAANHEVA
jgi:hypothetical protein